MSYEINIDHDNKLIRYKHTGNIKAENIEEAWQQFLTMKEFTEENYNLMSDYRNSQFDIHRSQVHTIIDFMKTIEHIVRGKKQSLIVVNPYSTAASEIFAKMVFDETGFKVKVFYTTEAAFDWLCDEAA